MFFTSDDYQDRRCRDRQGINVTAGCRKIGTRPADTPARDKRALVVHGRENEESRALFVVSALYHCVDCLRDRPVRFIDVDSVAVEIAVEAFCFDTGVHATTLADRTQEVEEAFRGAALYVGVALSDDRRIPRSLALAYHTPCLILAQFPSLSRMTGRAVANLSAAQNPRRFASMLASRLT